MDLLKVFRKPTTRDLLLEELEEARRHLQVVDQQREYATKMVDFYKARIRSLSQQMKDDDEPRQTVQPKHAPPSAEVIC